MQPPRKTGIGAGGITAIVAAVIVIPALLFIAVTARLMTVAKNHISQGANEPTNSYGNASPSDPNQADPEPTSTVYRMDERPGYESMVTYVTDKLDHYKDEILNNTTMFMSEYRIPDTQNGTDYMTGYMAALLGTVNEAKAAADETSEDPDALDAKIDSYRTTVDTLEARFKKGQALGVSMTVTGNDGKKYTVDGSKSITLRPTWDELEQRVAKASNSLGSGNAASAQKLVELADMKLSWDIDEGFRQCPAFAGTDDGDNKALTKSETFGFYCPATPNVIYGNRSMPDWNMTYAGRGREARVVPPRHPHALRHHRARGRHAERREPHRRRDEQLRGQVHGREPRPDPAEHRLRGQHRAQAVSHGCVHRPGRGTHPLRAMQRGMSNRAGFWSLIAFRGGASGSFGHLSAFRGVGAEVEPGRKPHDSNAGCPRILRISRSGNPLKRR